MTETPISPPVTSAIPRLSGTQVTVTKTGDTARVYITHNAVVIFQTTLVTPLDPNALSDLIVDSVASGRIDTNADNATIIAQLDSVLADSQND